MDKCRWEIRTTEIRYSSHVGVIPRKHLYETSCEKILPISSEMISDNEPYKCVYIYCPFCGHEIEEVGI